MKSQPLAYNKDNQEDKEPLFDTADTLIDTLRIYADMMRGVTVKPGNMRAAVMQGFATATDLADYLVKKGMPFRDAHEVVAQAVRHADEAGVDLSELPLEALQGFSKLISDDVYGVLTPEGSLNARNHLLHRARTGTPPSQTLAGNVSLTPKCRLKKCSDGIFKRQEYYDRYGYPSRPLRADDAAGGGQTF